MGAVLAVHLKLRHPRRPGDLRIHRSRALGDKQRRFAVKARAARRGEQPHRVGVVALDSVKQLAGALTLLGGDKRLTLALDFRQHLGVEAVGLFLRPVLGFRRPGVQQAEEGHRFILLAQTGGNTLRQRAAEGIAEQIIRPLRLLLTQRSQVMLNHPIQIRTLLHWTVRTRRLNADDGPARAEVARQDAKLPGKAGRRMETEQRRAVAFAQRKKCFIPQSLRLLVAHLRVQQRAELAHRGGDHNLPRRNLALELAAKLCRQAHRQQRVSAEGKEVGLNVVDLAAQQRGKRLRDGDFGFAFRRAAGGFAGQLRQRQRLAVKLAVRAERQRADLQQHHRHPGRRQLGFERRQQRVAVQR